MSIEEVTDLGFKKLPHFTIHNALTFDLGRRRYLSLGSLGTPNEMLFICEKDIIEPNKITDLVCLHNFDYDGLLTKEKLEQLINWFKK